MMKENHLGKIQKVEMHKKMQKEDQKETEENCKSIAFIVHRLLEVRKDVCLNLAVVLHPPTIKYLRHNESHGKHSNNINDNKPI